MDTEAGSSYDVNAAINQRFRQAGYQGNNAQGQRFTLT